ncbi:unnamed protein product [Prunus armeniaca]|uniref:Uncharacterized protein n=1 Tax=Prunus armeniaca TaxID=36596 RepID=A0A6J5TVN7_PRUAR|nr:unnamed protein product [Prunus armeniaca]
MVCPIDSEIGDGFAPFSISSKRGPQTIHRSPCQGNKNNKGNNELLYLQVTVNDGATYKRGRTCLMKCLKGILLGRPPRASSDTRSSSILPPEASIRRGFATNPISGAGHADSTPGLLAAGDVDSTPPGTKTKGLLSAAMKKNYRHDENLITYHMMKNPSALPSFLISTYLESNKIVFSIGISCMGLVESPSVVHQLYRYRHSHDRYVTFFTRARSSTCSELSLVLLLCIVELDSLNGENRWQRTGQTRLNHLRAVSAFRTCNCCVVVGRCVRVVGWCCVHGSGGGGANIVEKRHRRGRFDFAFSVRTKRYLLNKIAIFSDSYCPYVIISVLLVHFGFCEGFKSVHVEENMNPSSQMGPFY